MEGDGGGVVDGTKESVVVRSSRAPIQNVMNGWVQVGMENVCVQYTIIVPEEMEEEALENENVAEEDEKEQVVEVVQDEEQDEKDNEEDDEAKEMIEQVIHDKGSSATETSDAEATTEESPPASARDDSATAAAATSNVSSSLGGANLGGPSAMTEELVAKGNENVQQQNKPEEDQQQQQATAAEITSPTQQQQQQAQSTQQVQTQSSQGAHPGRAPIDIPASESSLSANAVANAAAAASSAQSQSSTNSKTATSKLNMTKILHAKFKPMWLTAKEGWNGGSHSDAIEFCKSIRGKRLCPYAAMCPHGPGNEVMGGRHRLEFVVNGMQYAPVLGGENHWVMVGTTEDGEAKCKTHRQLEGHDPAWGLTGDNAEMKQHVMCCTVE